jgi:hypothetical protein
LQWLIFLGEIHVIAKNAGLTAKSLRCLGRVDDMDDMTRWT